eukprot:TRINITY_DN5231_c0_g1_i1.p1 TRINITY_DN5231_c0_g1~~TRINITY_DN5231_c0_g1_i1.p1  ORF type:complete len:134 (-),score=46.59 TRINITY_DN5231_c0_g1_i1:50-451(-)
MGTSSLKQKKVEYTLAKFEEDFMQQLLCCDDIDVPDDEWRTKRREMIKTIQSHQQQLDSRKKEVYAVLQKRKEAADEKKAGDEKEAETETEDIKMDAEETEKEEPEKKEVTEKENTASETTSEGRKQKRKRKN